ncbi:MAG: insulinase family protein [Deltaproteobacteria bacterium]|nr:insulinase family protein [Deltaproteobacteria bacterium]
MRTRPSASTPSPRSAAGNGGTESFTLPNGLHVIVREDHFASVVALQAWVKVGAADEEEPEAGVAHVHEHMLFKGTQRRGVGQIAAEVESSGGNINAFTTADHTVYHLVLAGRHFATGLDILADALRNSAFDATELARELKVVMEEWKRSEDMPVARGYTELFRRAFTAHPYGRPVIGWKKTIEALDRPKVLSFFHRWYVPNNIVLIVVGDVSPALVREQVTKAFADWEAAALPVRQRPTEPPQRALVRTAITMPVQEHHLLLGFRVPSGHDRDAVPLDLLSYVLAGGESTRLVTLLEAQKELVNSISAFAYTPQDPGVFVLLASLERAKIAAATTELLTALARTRTELVSRAEMARARGNLESEFVYRKETMQGQARLLGYSQCVFEDPGYETRYLAELAAATREDVQRVATAYLRPENMVAVLVGPDAARHLPKAEQMTAPLAAPPPVSPRRARTARRPTVHARTLGNGVRLVVKEHHATPLVALRAVTLGGLLFERPENNGINNFLAGLLTRGSRHHSRESLGRAVESLAASIDGFSGRNSFGLRGQFMARTVEEGTDLFLEVLRHPTFPPDEIEKRRRELLIALSHRDDDPASRAIELFYATHFPHHPYGMTTLGERTPLRSFTRSQLAAYYKRLLAPARLVVSAVGDLDAPWMLDRLEAALGDLPLVRPLVRPLPTPPNPRIQRVTRQLDRQQAHFVLGMRGGRITDSDRAVLKTLEAILSRQGGRLFLELRDRQGLAYTVSAFASEGVDPGVFGIYFACAPDAIERAVAGVLHELRRLRDEPVSADELGEARTYLLGSYEISLQTNASQGDELAFNEAYGLGVEGGERYRESLAHVTPAAVQAAARGYLTLDAYTLAVVGPKGAKATSRKAAPGRRAARANR